MRQPHLLVLPKKAVFREFKHVTIEGVEYVFTLYTYDNPSGFVHFAILSEDFGHNLAHAKAQYYNRTWERYTGQAVYREAVSHALRTGHISKAEYHALKEALE